MHTTRIALTGLAALSLAAPAAAIRPTEDGGSSGARGTVDVAPGHKLAVRSAPDSGAGVLRRLRDGRGVLIRCQTTGSTVTGTYGTSSTWDKLKKGGYVSDAYINTGSDGRVAPDCPGGTPAPTPAPSGGLITMCDDYPYKADSPDGVDPWGFYKRECVSFVAYRLNQVMSFSNRMNGGHFGNAMNWDDNARKLGFKVNHRPTVGSVMVRNSGSYGHVAMVAKVDRPGKRIYVEQYNAGGTHTYSQAWLDVESYMDFIHFTK